MMSSVIYYSTDARKNEIYLLNFARCPIFKFYMKILHHAKKPKTSPMWKKWFSRKQHFHNLKKISMKEFFEFCTIICGVCNKIRKKIGAHGASF